MKLQIFLTVAGAWLAVLALRWAVLATLRQAWVHMDDWFAHLEQLAQRATTRPPAQTAEVATYCDDFLSSPTLAAPAVHAQPAGQPAGAEPGDPPATSKRMHPWQAAGSIKNLYGA